MAYVAEVRNGQRTSGTFVVAEKVFSSGKQGLYGQCRTVVDGANCIVQLTAVEIHGLGWLGMYGVQQDSVCGVRVLHGDEVVADYKPGVKAFSTGSKGWWAGGKDIWGETKYQVQVQVVKIGSKG